MRLGELNGYAAEEVSSLITFRWKFHRPCCRGLSAHYKVMSPVKATAVAPTAEMGKVIFVSVSTTPPRWIFSLFLVLFFLWAIVLLDPRHFTILLNT